MRSTPYRQRRGRAQVWCHCEVLVSSSIAHHQPCSVDSIFNRPVLFSFPQSTLSIRRRGCTAPFASRLRPLSCLRPRTGIELGCIRLSQFASYFQEVQPWTTQ
jgi:hypothetical protein